MAWAAGGLAVAGLLVWAVLGRQDVVRLLPRTASLYAAVGLPVNPVGLSIEAVRAEPSLQDGHATLAVSGVIRNVVDRPLVAPALRITLLNAQGRPVGGQIASLANAKIPAGETRRFSTALFDPPFSAQDIQVDFALGMKVKAPILRPLKAAQASGPAFTLRGSAAPEEAPAANAVPVNDADLADTVPAPTPAANSAAQ